MSKPDSSHLTLGAVDVEQLRLYYRTQLIELINERYGSKTIVLDKQLEPSINLIGDLDFTSFFRSIEGVSSLQTLNDELISSATPIIYVVRPTLTNMRLIAHHIESNKRRGKHHEYTLLLTPRKTLLCERELAECGVLDQIHSINEFQLEFMPVEHDVLSLESELAFRELFLDNDPSILYPIARSLMKLQMIYGVFPVVKGKGTQSAKVWSLMQRMRRDWPLFDSDDSFKPSQSNNQANIGGLLMLDRTIDLVTPLMTPLTYEGLIDELFAIHSNVVELPADLLTAAAAAASGDEDVRATRTNASAGVKQKMKKLPVTNTDSIFAECRDLSFRSLPNYLHHKATSIAQTYDDRGQLVQDTPQEALAYIKRFKVAHNEHSLLNTHVALAELIKFRVEEPSFDRRLEIERLIIEGTDNEKCEDFIDALIGKQAPLSLVMRMLGLLSFTQGIRAKKFDSFKRDLLQTYGFDKLLAVNNLEKLGFLASSNKKATFTAVKKVLRLVCYDRLDPNDVSYVYGGYAPMLVRLIESAMRPGWKRMDEVMTLIHGTSFEYRQDLANKTDPALALAEATLSVVTPPLIPMQPPPIVPTTTSAVSGLRGFFGKSKAKEVQHESPSSSFERPLSPLVQSLSSQNFAGGIRKKKIIFVLLLGGVTFAEINALRSLSQREDHDFEYVILTTKLLNGDTLMNAVTDSIVDPDVQKLFKRSIYNERNYDE